ncbi:MAG: hypothetical protein ABIJ57_15295, partial [Pseudomonadota bacterium]
VLITPLIKFGGKEGAVMSQKLEEKTSFDGSKVQVLGETYEEGKPEKPENWREKLKTREEMMAYLKTGVR